MFGFEKQWRRARGEGEEEIECQSFCRLKPERPIMLPSKLPLDPKYCRSHKLDASVLQRSDLCKTTSKDFPKVMRQDKTS